MRPLYIFDLDGTLALTEHRQHLVQCEKPDWRAFFAACVHDEPNWPVIDTLNAPRRSGADVVVWSGRSAEVQDETRNWLHRHVFGHDDFHLVMRREGDHQPDEQLKLGWLQSMFPANRRRLVAIFDDRDKVVAMWRANGVPCFQVAPGGF